MMGYQWNERMQAKWNLRRVMSDLGAGIPSSLHAVLDESDLGLMEDLYPDAGIHLKSSYTAFQNVTAIFDGRVERVPSFTTSLSSSTFACHGYRRTDIDKAVVVVWHRSLMPDGTVNPVRSADFTVSSRFSEPVLVDLLTGYMMALPQSVWSSDETGTSFVGLRLSDYPMVVAEKEAVLPAYDRWANERYGDLGLVDVNMTAPLADQDGDGIANLLAFATARVQGGQGSPVAILQKGDRHALSFRYRSGAGVDYIVEGSNNLKDWNPVARLPKGGAWQLEEGASVLGASLGDGIHEVQVSDTDAGAVEDKRFLRLRVE